MGYRADAPPPTCSSCTVSYHTHTQEGVSVLSGAQGTCRHLPQGSGSPGSPLKPGGVRGHAWTRGSSREPSPTPSSSSLPCQRKELSPPKAKDVVPGDSRASQRPLQQTAGLPFDSSSCTKADPPPPSIPKAHARPGQQVLFSAGVLTHVRAPGHSRSLPQARCLLHMRTYQN